MGKDKARKGTQQTRMDQYTAQTMSGPLPQESSCPLNKGSEPTGTQILAAIEASGQAVKSQIAAIAVDTPKAVWDWLERGCGDGTPRPQSGGVREQPAKMGKLQSALRQTTRRRRATGALR
ncbi:hypothetical protein NDU88_002584 [Pleurodeles waltl]|uniref:Uncharacterized protein n=1 Tax=Pleurodeles waltl TaxID=8319 RepID=A0AAV7T3P5_PLEWA|nr:hypothetical protein NDU88_002584 [Pleurodeles waltl]